ncbi:hypothetical protein [Candidatus Ulvibacter alkanivorans]|uniref:hypothetical protein n=1 Tax=Candidatus Ulvibacter alkanivorans TaxID=2267620 RepID=UPI000DF30A18|nr:hypothetical protein [Candidatus Ulvibacter alkanivorans]
MARFFTYCLYTLGVAFILLNVIALGSLASLRNSSFYKPSFLSNSVKESTFDYVIIGSSTGLTTLNTVLIDSITKQEGINLSMDDTSMNSHYLMLQHFLAENKSAKRCILSFNYGDMENAQPSLSGNDYRFLPFVRRPYVHEYYVTLEGTGLGLLSTSKYLPFLGVGYYNAELFFPSIVTLNSPKKRNRFDAKGNYVYPDSRFPSESKKRTIRAEMNNPYLKMIKAICDENDIELLLYHPPMYQMQVSYKDTTYNLVNHSDLLAHRSLFYDDAHVNKSGRLHASVALANVLNTKTNR